MNPEQKALILKTLSHPVRLQILRVLMDGPSCVQEANEVFDGLSQPNLSQHLSALKKCGVVDCRVEGKKRCYFICRPTLVQGLVTLLEQEHEYRICPKLKDVGA
ncbi:ArsR/SmtB family transcription factor [Verrucomicrobiota bacterium]